MRSFLTEHSSSVALLGHFKDHLELDGHAQRYARDAEHHADRRLLFPEDAFEPDTQLRLRQKPGGNLLDDGIGLHNRHARCVRRAVLGLQFDLRRSILHLRPLLSKVKLRQSRLATRRSRRRQCPAQNDRRREGELGRSARRDDMLPVLKERKKGRIFPR